MNLLLFGPPGAGKGTQSQILVDKLGLVHLSTGDLFRAAIKGGTELGLKAQSYMDKGELVPDSVVVGMVKEKLEELERDTGFILDGFPRTVAQAQALEQMLGSLSLKLDACVFLEVPREDLVRRLSGRRVCKNCGAVYHVDSKPTSKEGVCDICEGQVVQRPDDEEAVIVTRLQTYEENTQPLKEYYDSQELLVGVDGVGSTEEVFSRIQSQLEMA